MIKNFNVELLLENNFEPKIIYRGEEYYYKNRVNSIVWNGNNSLEASIIGTDIYSVIVNIKNGEINEFSCNCPYEYHCKHEVAVLIYIWDNLNKINSLYEINNKQLKELENKVKELSKKELEKLILELLFKDNRFRNYLIKHLKVNEKV